MRQGRISLDCAIVGHRWAEVARDNFGTAWVCGAIYSLMGEPRIRCTRCWAVKARDYPPTDAELMDRAVTKVVFQPGGQE